MIAPSSVLEGRGRRACRTARRTCRPSRRTSAGPPAGSPSTSPSASMRHRVRDDLDEVERAVLGERVVDDVLGVDTKPLLERGDRLRRERTVDRAAVAPVVIAVHHQHRRLAEPQLLGDVLGVERHELPDVDAALRRRPQLRVAVDRRDVLVARDDPCLLDQQRVLERLLVARRVLAEVLELVEREPERRRVAVGVRVRIEDLDVFKREGAHVNVR